MQPIEAVKTCIGDMQTPNLHLSSSQLLSKFSDKLAHLLVRHVTGGLCPPTSTGRQRPSGLHSWPLTIRKEDHSVSGTTLFFHPTFKVQHPTSTIQPSALPLSPANRTYPAATKQCQDAICSLLPCNTGAILGCFFGKTQRMKYCASHVQSNLTRKKPVANSCHHMCSRASK